MKPRKEMIRMGTKVGATIGGIAFLIFGLVPGFYFGSYGALIVMQRLAGGPVEPSVLARLVIAAGVLLGIFCIASVSIVVGSIAGTALAYGLEAITSPEEAKETAEAAVKAK